ncbi:YhbY family RNA-binding protein [Candidatus Pacearchaeota archaeon]|nr:YhbY family RNA-binding protein [Candidatus Pacearchaeota archaeon]
MARSYSQIPKIQLGKKGLTENFFQMLMNCFKNHKNVKIAILPGAEEERKNIKEISQKIVDKLGKNYTSRVIGFTIVVKKWRNAKD